MGLLIKGGTVVNSEGQYRADVWVDDDGVIQQIGHDLEKVRLTGSKADRVVDASGQFVFPGGIDAHTHMELPFMGTTSADNFENGTVAGCVGGTTGIIDFVIPSKGQSNLDALGQWNEKAGGKAVSDYAFHMAIVEWTNKTAEEMEEVARRGITSFKTFTAYKGALMLDDRELFNVMLKARDLKSIVTVHAVNGDVLSTLAERFAKEGKLSPAYHPKCQPPEAEGEATFRAIQLARIAGIPLYVVHVTCDDALQQIHRANGEGTEIYAETCIQYLLLDDSLYEKPDFEGAKYVLSPPLRKKQDQVALWEGIQRGHVHTLATDHCPFHFESQKTMGKEDFRKIPNGLPGVEERISLLYTYGVAEGKITWSQLVDVCSTRPAKIFNMYPKKGAVAVGADADLVVFDPAWESTFSAKTHKSKVDYSCYEGWKRKGRPSHVFVRGRLVAKDGEFCGERGFGRFVERSRYARR
ncbi:MAG TPA: dihydropyrimidinase [Planctomycetota bacterium]|nr:dihydropyrimidinase [Planctomycetota bacterium]